VRLLLRSSSLAALCLIALALGLGACGGSLPTTVTTPANGHRPALLSIIEDDNALASNPTGTLATFKMLGAQVVRYNAQWGAYAPADASRTEPAGFNAVNPRASGYRWAVLDAIDRDVAGAGMRLDLTLTSPAPLWATSPAAPRTDDCVLCDRWEPSATDFGQWVEAVGRRYDGHFTPPGQSTPLPRVSFWSIWNEPNYGPNLTPQSMKNASNEVLDTAAPQYRKLVNAGWQGLAATGHTVKTDTILIGETAPRGFADPGLDRMTPPLQFIRDLYCVDGSYKPLNDSVATALGCPTNGSSTGFAQNNPALFQASGWADHPYPDGIAPDVKSGSAAESVGWADFARLGDLEGSLDKATAAWGAGTTMKIYNTEFGYFTNPPLKQYDSLAPPIAARDLNWAEYLSWQDPRIASYDQYLLVDPAASSTSQFDTGLELNTGNPIVTGTPIKSVFDAYRLPLWLPQSTGPTGTALRVWGCARPALTESARSDAVKVQFSADGGTFRTLKTVTVHPATGGCYFDAAVTFPSSGNVRLAYRAGGHTVVSRVQAITLH
jgi:hypothetical protein